MSKVKPARVAMPEQVAEVRITNFQEVTLGYTSKNAIEEANRCLECKSAPCISGCPVNVPIPQFIHAIKENKINEAYELILKENSFPSICGRVCPQEKQCEAKCVRGIKGEAVAIGRLERYVADACQGKKIIENGQDLEDIKGSLSTGDSFDNRDTEKTKKIKIAVVGSGPAGLACASDLAGKNYQVTLFEALHELGGVLVYGIPEFRLPKSIVKREVDAMVQMGVHVEKNVVVGKSITIEELMDEGYKAVFVGGGAGLPRFLNIPGENANGVYSSNEFLTRVNLMKAYKFPKTPTPVNIGERVAVVGAGNVAMDCARTAKRLGAKEVSIIYRRSEEEIPARLEEVHHAKEEGIMFKLLTNPTKIIENNGYVEGMVCDQMALGEPDASGRRKPIKIEGSSFEMPMDTVIIAAGQSPNPLIKDTTKAIEVATWGGILVDEKTSETTMENVYAGGDAVTGAATVILAMGAGKKAAKAIHEKFGGSSLSV